MDDRDCRSPAVDHPAGGGGAAAGAGAPGAAAHALRRCARRPGRLGRCAARAADGPARPGGHRCLRACRCSWASCCRCCSWLAPAGSRRVERCPGTASLQWAWQQRAAGRHQRGAGGRHRAAAGLSRCGAAAMWSRAAVVRLAGLGYAVPGAVIAVGHPAAGGWLQRAGPTSPTVYWVTGTALGSCRPTWCGSRRWRCSPCKAATRACRPASTTRARMLGTGRRRCWRGCTGRCCGARRCRGRSAGVRRRDEGTARHAGAAALQQRHAGGGGLPAGARRAPGRSRAALAGIVCWWGCCRCVLLSRALRAA